MGHLLSSSLPHGDQMKGFIQFWFGFAILLLFGFLAAIMSGVFAQVAPSYSNSTLQLIIMIAIPIMGFAVLYGFFGGGGE